MGYKKGVYMKKKKLKDLHVVEMRKELFVSDKPIYRFGVEGIPLMDIPHGSLIYTGETVPGPGVLFNSAVCGIWKGGDKIEETKRIVIRNLGEEKDEQSQKDKTDAEPGD